MIVAVVVPFQDEERLLPTLLDSLARQERPPERLLLVDDGSRDRSAALAARWAAGRPWATLLRRPPRARARDRLATAAELAAFQWALDQIDVRWDALVKLDADLRLPPDLLAAVERELLADPSLGIVGAHLSTPAANGARRERVPPWHVRGAVKCYRRACWEAIAPLPAILGWDTIDEARARMRGWSTRSVSPPGGDALHLRPAGGHDGRLRAYRRWGACAYGYGSHPLAVLLGAGARARHRPYGLCGANFLAGWTLAALQSAPRADPETRRQVRREQLRRLTGRAHRSASRLA